jgi:hypothetical protein
MQTIQIEEADITSSTETANEMARQATLTLDPLEFEIVDGPFNTNIPTFEIQQVGDGYFRFKDYLRRPYYGEKDLVDVELDLVDHSELVSFIKQKLERLLGV